MQQRLTLKQPTTIQPRNGRQESTLKSSYNEKTKIKIMIMTFCIHPYQVKGVADCILLLLLHKTGVSNKTTLATISNGKVKEDNDQEMAQSERNSHSTNRGVGKSQNDI